MADIFVFSCLLLLVAPLSEGCTCMPTHPQAMFCHSDFVVLATPGRRMENIVEYTANYNLTVHKFLKKPENISDLIQTHEDDGESTITIETALFGSLCGASLESDVKYILGGSIGSSGFSINLCGLRFVYSEVSKRLWNGLSHKFNLHCDCEVKYCGWGNCGSESSDICRQDHLIYPLECSDKFSMCRRGPDGQCHWTDNKYNRLCVEGARRRLRI